MTAFLRTTSRWWFSSPRIRCTTVGAVSLFSSRVMAVSAEQIIKKLWLARSCSRARSIRVNQVERFDSCGVSEAGSYSLEGVDQHQAESVVLG